MGYVKEDKLLIWRDDQIYSTGKSLNFMKHSCKDSEWVATRDRVDGISRSELVLLLSFLIDDH